MIPSLEQCLEICNKNSAFKFKLEEIENRKVYQFNYFLATVNDFLNPLKQDEITVTAEELRGLTFVEQSDGSFKRYLMLHKFFNINQTEFTQYNKVKHEKIVSVSEKLDGSFITFVEINGKVFAKSKFSFFSEQAKMAQEIYNSNKNIKTLVDKCLETNIQPFFELISPRNQIVIRYPKTELVLIQLRDSFGKYAKKNFVRLVATSNNVAYAKYYGPEYTFDFMMSQRETLTGQEGWVITCESGLMLKCKLVSYLQQHHIMTNIATKENEIIQFTLNEEIDDILASIPLDSVELREFIETISSGIVNHINKLTDLIFNKRKTLFDTYPNKKDYAQKTKELIEPEYFTLMMRVYSKSDIEDIEKEVVEFVKRKTSKLNLAREYLAKIGINATFKDKKED